MRLLANLLNDGMADVWRALSHPLRREVLTLLKGGGMTAGALGDRFDCAAPTLSAHLRTLLEADLVTVEAEGSRRVYRLNATVAEDALLGLLRMLRVGEEAGTPREGAGAAPEAGS